MNPSTSILIPAYNEEPWIGRTIDSIHYSFSEIAGPSYEIIVCDNHSTDQTARAAQSKGAQVVYEPHHQIARARNTAARNAKGKLLIFMDADTHLNSEVLKETIRNFEHKNIGAGGVIVTMKTQGLSITNRLFVWICCWLWKYVSIYFKLAAGSYLYCHREAWLETGGFDESFYVSEEIDFSNKLKTWCRKKGLKFRIITKAIIVTSSRKVHWYTPWQNMKQMVSLLFTPQFMRKRERCYQWYTRPKNFPTTIGIEKKESL